MHFPPSVHAVVRTFSASYANGSTKFSRLPDSATLAPLRMAALISHKRKDCGECIVAAIGCGAAYPGSNIF